MQIRDIIKKLTYFGYPYST